MGGRIAWNRQNRCDRDFLSGFIARNPGFVSTLRTGIYLSARSDVNLIVRLRLLDLLPEAERLRHVAEIRVAAVEIPDSDFLQERFRLLFTTTEFDDILGEVNSQLLPNIPKCIADWRNDYDGEKDPDSYFDLLRSALKDYREVLSTDIESIAFIEAGLAEIEEVIEELRLGLPQESEDDRDYFRDSQRGGSSDDSRSIFDDVDH